MSDSNTALKVTDLNKSFKLPHEQSSGLKQMIVNIFNRKRGYEVQHVLKDVSFEIKKGEFFGIVGRNGSGKSTLLKLMAGIYTPDSGAVQVNGSLTPFIELGVGFNPELTGRENVFLNGALLGFSKDEMEAMYDDIVEFAELGKFMDQKLKNYSSGMQVRLAFSIAIRAQSDILLLDEVLAVGDEAFQKKCFEYFAELKRQKQTVILVTHDMTNVERFCDKALVLHDNQMIGIYGPMEAKMIYEQLNRSSENELENGRLKLEKRWGTKEATFTSVKLNNSKKKRPVVTVGEPFEINIQLASDKKKPVIVGLAIYDEDGMVLSGPNSEKVKLYSQDNVTFRVPSFPINPGTYKLRVALYEADHVTEYDHIEDAVEFEVVTDSGPRHGKVSLFGEWTRR